MGGERYFVKPLEVHSLLRMAGRRREKRRRSTGDGTRTISAVTSSLLQCQTVTNQSAVGAVSTAATVQSSVCESQILLNKERPGWYLSAPSSNIYSLVVKEWRGLAEKLIYVWNSQIFLQTVVR